MELKKIYGLILLLQACFVIAGDKKSQKKAAPARPGEASIENADMEFLQLPPSTASACTGSTKTGAKKTNISQ